MCTSHGTLIAPQAVIAIVPVQSAVNSMYYAFLPPPMYVQDDKPPPAYMPPSSTKDNGVIPA